MLLIDPKNGDIVDANSAATTYYGWNHTDLIKKKVNGYQYAPPKKKVIKELARAQTEAKKPFLFFS